MLSRGFAHLAALGLMSMMLHYKIVKSVMSVGLARMDKTGCSENTRLVLEPESFRVVDNVVVFITFIVA